MIEYPQEKKEQVVIDLCSRAGSAKEVADQYGVNCVALYEWKKQLLGQMGFSGFGRTNECQVSVCIYGRQGWQCFEFDCIPAFNNREIEVAEGFGIFQW